MIANRTCVISSTWEKGAGKPGTSQGPTRVLSLFESLGFSFEQTIEIRSNDENVDEFSSSATQSNAEINPIRHGQALTEHCIRLSSEVEECAVNGMHSLILSGDHSNAIGSVSGLCRALGGEHLGVIWIDAHLDLHSPFTTPSGNIHGMSVNALLEDDNQESAIHTLKEEEISIWKAIKKIKNGKPANCILPEHLIFIGTRSYEEQEWKIIQKHNILVITKEEIEAHGIQWMLKTVNERLERCLYRYVSFDVDSLDSSISSATGTPEANGLDLPTAKALLQALWNHPRTVSMEITEFNPSLPQPEKLEAALLECFNGIDRQ